MSGEPRGKEPGDGKDRAQDAPTANAGAVRHVRSADLFGDAREVVIEHEHHRYRLKMTSRGGLILNK
jgi:hemin uptake protein HemP